MKIVRSLSMAALLLSASLAPANAETVKKAPKDSQTYNPDEKVCEDVTMLGSRLVKKRACTTRAQWEEKRRMQRGEIDRAQTQICAQNRPGTC